MNERDKLHLLGGVAVAAILCVTILVAINFRTGLGLTIGSMLIGVGVEGYQYIRKEGVPSWRGALTSALPGVILGIAWEILRGVL